MYIKIDENNKVVSQINDKFATSLTADNVTTFKTQTCPDVPNGELLYYDPEAGNFYTKKVEVSEEDRAKAKQRTEAVKQKNAALKLLAENDWMVNKRMLGEWEETDERWLAYLAGRAKARSDYDEAVAILNG